MVARAGRYGLWVVAVNDEPVATRADFGQAIGRLKEQSKGQGKA